MDMKDVFSRLLQREEARLQYKKYQFEVLNNQHVLKDVLGKLSPVAPYILASQVVDVIVTEDTQNVDSSVWDDVNQKDESIESLDGSPMKLRQFSVDSHESHDSVRSPKKRSRHVELRKPLSMKDTRHLISQYTLYAQKQDCSLPVWALCEDSTEPCVCLGVYVTTNKQNRTEIHLYDVSCNGPTNDISKVADFKKVLSEHMHRSGSKRVEKQCVAEYNIFESVSADMTQLTPTQKLLVVEASWKKVTSLLQTPPLDACSCVHARVCVGDMQSATYSLYTELHTLQDFAAGLKDGLVNWAVENQDVPPLPKVKALLEELKLGDAAWRQKQDRQEKEEVDELTSPLKSNVLVERLDLDFTDHLWNVLQECGSYQQLTECLQYVLDCLKAGTVQPRIHRRNKSQLGQFVRDSYYNKMVVPPLVDLLPLQLLVGTGIEKLAADYSAALIGKELVTASHLTHFVEIDLDTVERVSRLNKLHLALELAVTLEQHLNVPRFNIGVAVRNALQYYETNTGDECHTFTVSIPTSTGSAVFERCQPTKWMMSLVSSLDDHVVHTNCLLTVKSPFAYTSHQGEPPLPENEDCETSYFWTVASESVVLM